MSEGNKNHQPAPQREPHPSTRSADGEAIQRAESSLGAGTGSKEQRAQETYADVEKRPTADQQSGRINDADALTNSKRDEGGEAETAAEEKVDEALEEEAREESVTAADDAASIEWGLIPHNI